jgi:hypothetical protein
MCIAIYKPADTAPDWVAYENGYENNDDSWGFAVVQNGELICEWGVGGFANFRESFEPYAQCQALIHFRIATSGLIDLHNCHPFTVSDELAFIHNGVINIDRNLNDSRSDTWHFNELVLKPMYERDPDFFLRGEIVYTMRLAHSGSKFVFLHASGDYRIWNEGDGVWEPDGHWYSNTSFRTRWGLSQYYSGSRACKTVEVTYPDDSDSAALREYDRYAERAMAERQSRSDWYYDEDSREEERHEQHFASIMEEDLRGFGFSNECIAEVRAMLGHDGLTALHDTL